MQVSECVWGGEQESSSEEGGGGVTWETPAMEVKGQLIPAPGENKQQHLRPETEADLRSVTDSVWMCVTCVCADPLTCPDRKQRERMAELQERRRSLQVLLSTRLAELRRICLQEAVSDVIIRPHPQRGIINHS